MKDDQVEDLLRRVRPAGPPLELRARILASRAARPVWPWTAAAAALLALIVGLQWSAGQLREDARPPLVASTEESEMATLKATFNLTDEEVRAIVLARVFDRMLVSSTSPETAAR